MQEMLIQWVSSHGYSIIFMLFAFGIIGLPVPSELVLAYLGFLIYQGQLHGGAAFAAAFLGSVSGMSVNYGLGRTVGCYLVRKFGYSLGVTEGKIAQAHVWFERKGKWGLIAGYFLPGIRHITALVAGTSRMLFPEFVLFMSLGAFIWTILFISAGYFFKEQWSRETEVVRHVLSWCSVVVAVLAALYWAHQKRTGRKK